MGKGTLYRYIKDYGDRLLKSLRYFQESIASRQHIVARAFLFYMLYLGIFFKLLKGQSAFYNAMKTKMYMNALLILGLIFTMIPMAGCSKDDDEELGSNGGAVLTVNGKKWEAVSLPVFDESGFFFNCTTPDRSGHALIFDEDLTDEDLEKGDDVSPDAVVIPTENAVYRYDDGEVIVTKCSSKSVTLRFDNYKVQYSGMWEDMLGDNRGDDIADAQYLTMNGTVTFTYK